MRVQSCLLGLAFVAATSVFHDADAILRGPMVNAVGACQPALPAFDGNIRKRPTGLANEGAGPAFVSCSVYGDLNTEIVVPSQGMGIMLSNTTGSAVDITCTLVNGVRFVQSPSIVLIPKTFTVPANETVQTTIEPSDGDNGPFTSPVLSLSCNLPVGTELNALYTLIEDGSAPAE